MAKLQSSRSSDIYLRRNRLNWYYLVHAFTCPCFDITDPPTRWCHIASGAVTLAEPDALKCPVCPEESSNYLISNPFPPYIPNLSCLPLTLTIPSKLISPTSCHSSPPSVPHLAKLSGQTWPFQLLRSIPQQSGAWKRMIGVSTPLSPASPVCTNHKQAAMISPTTTNPISKKASRTTRMAVESGNSSWPVTARQR